MSKVVNWLGLHRLPTVDEAFELLGYASAEMRKHDWLVSRMKGQR